MPIQGRDGWAALGTTLSAAGIAALVADFTVISSTPHGRISPWLPVGSSALFIVGVYIMLALALDWWLPAKQKLHEPPGGGLPFGAPVEYQLRQVRQIIKKLVEVGQVEFGALELDAVFRNHPRERTDPVHEPLQAVLAKKGLDELVRLGELEATGPWSYRIASGSSFMRAAQRPGRPGIPRPRRR